MSMYNPWMVPSLNEFTFLCCPECVFRSKTATSFQTHAIQNHPRSSVLFSAVKEEPPDFSDIPFTLDDENKGRIDKMGFHGFNDFCIQMNILKRIF